MRKVIFSDSEVRKNFDYFQEFRVTPFPVLLTKCKQTLRHYVQNKLKKTLRGGANQADQTGALESEE